MKILIVVNNHNSIGIVNFCVNLKTIEKTIEIFVVCDSITERNNEELFAKHKIARKIIKLDGCNSEKKKKYSIVGGVKELEKKSHNKFNKAKGISLFGSIVSQIVKFIFSSSIVYFFREKLISHRLRKYKEILLRYIKELNPDVVLSLSDRSHDYIESSTLWAARKCNIKILLPYIAQFDIDAALQYRLNSNGKPLQELRPFWPFSFYKIYSYISLKNQLYKGLFFQAPFILNASKKSDTLSSYPWWIGNGISDVVCVDSEYTARKYVNHRVKSSKIVMTGHVSYDKVFYSYDNRESIRITLNEKYSLNSESKYIVMSVPQYAEQGYMGWDEHWNEIDCIIREVSSLDSNLLLSIHPRSDVREYCFLQKKYNCKIIEEQLSEVIGVADIFMASNSSTFVWAVLCGIPSIALMSPVPFLYDYLESIFPVNVCSQLTAKIEYIFNMPFIAFEKDWELLGKNVVFDGKFNERFIKLLKDICEDTSSGNIIT